MIPAMLGMILVLAGVAQGWTLDPGLPSRLSESDLARGQALYAAHCQRCHGADGDDTRLEGITPLGGLSLRLGDPRNRNFGGPAFRARGRVYPPQEASALMGYILTLRGAKDFARPEGLVSPHLLDRKRARRTYLVVDVRSPAEFRKAHISNAANLPLRVLDSLARPALSPELRHRVVILYDEGSGLRAAKVWRALFQSGHRSVAILDGGLARWVAEDREITTAVASFLPARLVVDSTLQPQPQRLEPVQPSRLLRFDWRKTETDHGLASAADLTGCLRSAGFSGPGRYRLASGSDSLDLLVFQLHLLGFEVERGRAQELVVR